MNSARPRLPKHFRSSIGAALIVFAFAAPSAHADFSPSFAAKCTGSSVAGVGTYVQEGLHDRVFSYWKTHTSSTKTRGCGPRARQRVGYAPVVTPADGVDVADTQFGAYLSGRFVGLDRAPTPDERSYAETAARRFGPAKLYVTPIAQTAATVIVNFPKYCELPAGDPNLASYARFKISNETLTDIFVGSPSVDTWGELLPGIKAMQGNSGGKTDAACRAQAVKLVVPSTDSPYSRHLKRLLDHIAPGHGWGNHLLNGTWPVIASVIRAASGTLSAVADKTADTNGAIAWVDLRTARAYGFQKRHETSTPPSTIYRYQDANRFPYYPTFGRTYTFKQSKFWIPMEKITPELASGSGQFVEPTADIVSIRTGRKGANCNNARYDNVPYTPGGRVNHYGNWSDVIVRYTTGVYPGCVLTFMGIWDDPADVYGGGILEQAFARTVKDYATFVAYYGQNVLFQQDYAPVPYSTNKQLDLRWAPRRAATLMGWKKP